MAGGGTGGLLHQLWVVVAASDVLVQRGTAIGIDDWWTNNTSGYATHLFAEILRKIYDNYGVGNTPLTESVDYVFFVFASYWSPYSLYPPVGGMPIIEVNAERVRQETGAFYYQLSVYGEGPLLRFRGTGQAEERKDGILFKVVHELGHTFGFGEGPPAIHTALSGTWDTRRYYFGNYNAMCQHWIDTEKAPVWGLHWLAMTGWIETVDFAGENQRDVILYDIRTFKDPLDGEDDAKGRIYRFAKPDSQQYFVMGFHAGIGVDDRSDGGDPLLPAKGLKFIIVRLAIKRTARTPSISNPLLDSTEAL